MHAEKQIPARGTRVMCLLLRAFWEPENLKKSSVCTTCAHHVLSPTPPASLFSEPASPVKATTKRREQEERERERGARERGAGTPHARGVSGTIMAAREARYRLFVPRALRYQEGVLSNGIRVKPQRNPFAPQRNGLLQKRVADGAGCPASLASARRDCVGMRRDGAAVLSGTYASLVCGHAEAGLFEDALRLYGEWRRSAPGAVTACHYERLVAVVSQAAAARSGAAPPPTERTRRTKGKSRRQKGRRGGGGVAASTATPAGDEDSCSDSDGDEAALAALATTFLSHMLAEGHVPSPELLRGLPPEVAAQLGTLLRPHGLTV